MGTSKKHEALENQSAGSVRPPKSHSGRTRVHQISLYSFIGLGSFLCGVGLLGLMLWKVETLAALGLTGNLYYLVLLPLGLCAALFLFGVQRSYASYRGQFLGGALELGGPVVVFMLVVIGGFKLVPNPTPFAVTVFVHGENGPQETVLKDAGYVVLDLGPDRRHERIGDKGQATFQGIPANFRGQEVLLWIDAAGFEPVNAQQKQQLIDGRSLYVAVRKKNGRIAGRVQDPEGKPIQGAEIRVAGLTAWTDAVGHFEFQIPGDRGQPELDLQVTASGYAPKLYKAMPNANELTAILTRTP